MPQSLPRKVYCQPLAGYRHMYRSLLRFFPITPQEALSLLYALYIGNLDTCHFGRCPAAGDRIDRRRLLLAGVRLCAPIPYGGADVPLHARTFAQHPL